MDELENLIPAAPIDRNTKRHFYIFDKMMLKIKANRAEYVPIEPTTEQEITFLYDKKELRYLGTTTINEVLYEENIISYEEYLRRRNLGL